MDKMGFETDRRLRKEYKNKRTTLEMDGITYNFRSKLESKVALYLQLLKDTGEIKDWWYEFMKFELGDDSWLIDFTVEENDHNFYHIEAKGHFEARDRRKLKLLFKYHPEARVLYVMQHKADVKRLGLARKYLWWRPPTWLNALTRDLV